MPRQIRPLLLVAAVILLVWGLVPLLRCDSGTETGQPLENGDAGITEAMV